MESVASVREDMVVPTMGEFDMTSFEAPEELETRNISARNNRKQQRRGTVAPGGNNRHGGDGDVVDSDDEGPLNESIFLSSMSRAHGFADPLPVYHDPLLDDGETYVNNHAEQHQNLIQMVGLSQQFPLSMRQAKDAQKAAAAGGAGGGQQPMKMTLNGSMLHPSQTKKGATIKAGASSVGAHLRHQHRLREQHLRQQQRAAAGGGGSSSSSDDDQPGRGGASDAFPQPLYAGGEDAQLEADNLMSGAAGETGSITSPQQQHQQTLITDPDSPVAPGPTASPAANNNFRAATPATKNFRPVRKFFKARLRQAKRFMNLLHFNDKMKERQFVVFNNDNDIEGIVAMVLSVLGAVFYFTTSFWTPQVWAFIFIIPLMSIITLVRVAFTIYSRYHRVQLNRLIDEVEQQRLKEEKEVEQLTKAEMFYRTRALMDQQGQKDSGGESDVDDRASKSKRREKKRAKAVVNTMENNEKVIDTAKMDFEVLQFHTAIWHERLVLIFIFLNNAIILLSYPNKQFCTRANDPIVNRDCRVSFWLWPGAYAAMLLYIFVSVPRIMPTTGALVVVHSIFFFVGRWFDTTDDEGVVYASQTILGFCICVVTLTFLYKSEEMRREMFTTAERVNRFRKQSEALLSRQGDHVESMVPPVIARILIDTKGNVSFSYEGTVACIRMGHVTRWCSERSGAEIATQINDLFAILDRAAETTKVLHVQTFGDMYVVISGLGRFTTPIENAERACLFAAAVSDGRETQLRVAICSGEVHGVVRSRQLSYDLCGGTYDACISLVYQGEVPASVMNTATMRLTGCRTLGEIADRFAKEARDRRRRKRKVKRLQQQQGLSLKAAEERVSRMDDDEVASVKRAGGSSKKSTSSRDKHNSKGANNNNTITGPSANVVMILNGVTVSPSHFSIPTDDTPFNEDEEEPQQQQPATATTKKSDSPTHKKGAPTATGSLPVSRSGSKNAAAAAAKSSKSTGDRTSKNFLAKYANPDLNIHDLGIKVETDEIGDVDEMPPFMSRKLRGERFFAYTGLQTRLEKTRDRHISRGPLVPSLDFPDEEIEECFVRDVSIRVISSAAVVAGSLFFTGLSLGAFVLCYWDLRDRPDRDTSLAGIVSRVSFGMSSLASFFMLFCVRKLKVDNALWLYFPIMILFILGIVMAPPGILNNNLQVWSLVLYLISYMLLPPGVMSTLKWFILNGIVVAAPLSVATIVLDTFAVISTIAYHFAALIFLSYMHMQQEFQARSRFLDTILSYFLAKSLQAETVAMRELLQVPLQALSVLDRCSSVELPLLKKDEVDPLGMYGTNGRLRLLDLDLAEMTPIHQGVDETALLCIYFADGRDVAAFFGHNVKKEKGPLASVFLLRLCWAVCDEVVEAHGEGKVYKAGVFGGNVVLATVRDSLKAVGCLARCAQHILAKLASHGREVVTTCTLTAGPIASAVVGNKFLSFQLFGDTVQTASRVLAAAPPGSMTCSDRFAFLYECWCDEELDVWYSESEGEEEEIHNEEVCEITSLLINQQKNSTDAAAGAISNNGNVYGEEMMLAQPPSRNNSSYDNSVLPNQLAGSNTLHATSVNSFSTTSITTQPLATHPGIVTSPNSAPIQDLSVTSGSGFVSGSGAPPNLPDEGKKHHRRSGAAGSIVDPLQASAAIYGDGDNNYDDDMEDEEDGDMDDAFYPPLILHEPMPWKIRGRGVVRIRYVSVTVPEEPLD